ncbi:hypothetical protein [Shimia aestuarii]|uniref:hypothetical protein n=1 Tax=Shimia aestuarii TaxID=254406 RepID=UPI001FB53A77|nr:hypothetical protein [Shimia aestuarii]
MRWIPSLLVAGAAGLAIWWLVSVVQERAELRADLTIEKRERIAAQTALKDAEEAARVHRAWLRRLEDERAEYEALRRDLINMEGGDEALSDYLRGAGERLWGQ